MVALLFSVSLPTRVQAVHKGAGDLVCGVCHTMHNSQGTGALNTTGDPDNPALILLRGNVNSRAEIHKLCLQCHAENGTQANLLHPPQNVQAPKVYSSATFDWANDGFGKIGAGGNFSTELNSNWDATTPNYLGYGHSVGATNVTPPGGDTEITEFSCTNCHDPHGTSELSDSNINMFRNLKVNAFGAGNSSQVKFYYNGNKEYYKHKSYVGGVSQYSANGSYFGGDETDNAGQVIWPVYTERYGALTGNPVNDDGKTNSYGTGIDSSNGSYGSSATTMSRWCAQCHDKWHEEITPSNQAHVYNGPWVNLDSRRHMVNSMIPRAAAAGCGGACHISLLDRSNYNTADIITKGKGLPVTSGKFYAGRVYYLPECGAAGNPACSGMDDITGGGNHQVFCLTCHFVHGGPYYDNLRWNYTSSVGIGSQAANGIPSNVGCQLCHNR